MAALQTRWRCASSSVSNRECEVACIGIYRVAFIVVLL